MTSATLNHGLGANQIHYGGTPVSVVCPTCHFCPTCGRNTATTWFPPAQPPYYAQPWQQTLTATTGIRGAIGLMNGQSVATTAADTTHSTIPPLTGATASLRSD